MACNHSRDRCRRHTKFGTKQWVWMTVWAQWQHPSKVRLRPGKWVPCGGDSSVDERLTGRARLQAYKIVQRAGAKLGWKLAREECVGLN